MEFSGLSTYRSEGRGVNQTDNMVRVTVFATRNEWRRILSAVQNIERRKTVAPKRAVQQRKGKSLLCGYTGGCILRYKGKCTKSPGEVICGHRKPSPVA